MTFQATTAFDRLWRDPRAITLALGSVLVIMANIAISPALPGLEAQFAADPQARLLTRLLVPAPSLAVVVFAPFAGHAVDRWGRRRLLLAGLAVFVVSGPAGLYLPDLGSIFLSRLALGLAVAMIMSAQTALIGDLYQGDRRSGMVGLQISARNFGGMVLVGLAGLVAGLSPRAPFALYTLALIYLPLVWLTIQDVPSPEMPGSTASESVHAETGGFDAKPVSWLAPVLAVAALQVVTAMIFFLNPTQTPFFFDALGYDAAATTGLYLGLLTFSGGAAALLFARIKARIGYSGAYAAGFGLMALGFAALSLGAQAAWVPLAAVMTGAGYAVVTPIFIALALHLTPAHRRGFAGGLMMTAMSLGQFASPFVSVPAISAIGFLPVFRSMALVLAVMALVSAAVTAVGRQRRNRPLGDQEAG